MKWNRSYSVVAAGLLIAGVVAGAPATARAHADSATAAPSVASPLAAPVWLCNPALASDPCGPTVHYPSGKTEDVGAVDEPFQIPSAPPVDCFYVYPTIDTLPNPLLQVGSLPPAPTDPEMAVTLAQAERFAGTCRMFVPVYRQASLTEVALGLVLKSPADLATGEMDVAQAWQDYWTHDNIDPATGQRRGVILIGHSQGSADLITLIQHQIDGNAAMQHQLVAAYLLGGNVQVPIGQPDGGGTDAGATFQHIGLCSNDTRFGCVVAYSSYDEPAGQAPGATAVFGRPTAAGYQIACTNPHALLTGAAPDSQQPLDTYLPSRQLVDGNALNPSGNLGLVGAGYTLPDVPAGFAHFRGELLGQCRNQDGASWLQLTDLGGLLPTSTQTSDLGTHVVDYNVALGDLTALAARQAADWAANSSQ
ncbi:DUF3089 domain-containing protein [Catenulispora sp. NF23]|uniref:DUF3089 domain-containing protein n=1 Tax=Catenulispora pinistramenti TaxID=2705254 RepID=UPI001BA4A8A5|nr:DUF3089 domain-containing protein [Catenulispora pinistramenti]MBS2538049.1 DUF3089 domain-containing protein [Catenulispora pinistramenti]